MKKYTLWYCIFVLISIICLMLWNIPRMNESFEIKNNDELGGTIITLQQDLTTLQKQFQTITSSLEKTYKPIDLSGNVTTVQKLYHTIIDFNPLIFSITDSDILQPVKPENIKNATGDINCIFNEFKNNYYRISNRFSKPITIWSYRTTTKNRNGNKKYFK